MDPLNGLELGGTVISPMDFGADFNIAGLFENGRDLPGYLARL